MAELKDLNALTPTTSTWLVGQNTSGSGGKFAVSSILAFMGGSHNHDGVYALANHSHGSTYSPDPHSHAYAPAGHDHDDTYALDSHDHPEYADYSHPHEEYAPLSHPHEEYALDGHDHGTTTYAAHDHNHDGVYATSVTATIARVAAQTVADSTWTKILVDTTDENTLAGLDAVNNRLKAPTTGLYLIQADWAISGSTAQLAIVKNAGGSPTLPDDALIYSANGRLTRTVSLTANDHLTLYAYQASGGGVDAGAAVPYRLVFSLVKLS